MVLSGGTEAVQSGGTAIGAKIFTSGYQGVGEHATVIGTIILGGSQVTFSGSLPAQRFPAEPRR